MDIYLHFVYLQLIFHLPEITCKLPHNLYTKEELKQNIFIGGNHKGQLRQLAIIMSSSVLRVLVSRMENDGALSSHNTGWASLDNIYMSNIQTNSFAGGARTCIYRRAQWPPLRGSRPGGRDRRTLRPLWRGRRGTRPPGGRLHTRYNNAILVFGKHIFGTLTFRYTKSTDRTFPRSLHSFR